MPEVKPLTPEVAYCRATVRAWERLRLLYNTILLIPGVLVIWRTLRLQEEMMASAPPGSPAPLVHPLGLTALAVVFGVVANICYCLGPYAEFVVTALGFPVTGERVRYFVFAMGVLLSLAVVGMTWLTIEFSFLSASFKGM